MLNRAARLCRRQNCDQCFLQRHGCAGDQVIRLCRIEFRQIDVFQTHHVDRCLGQQSVGDGVRLAAQIGILGGDNRIAPGLIAGEDLLHHLDEQIDCAARNMVVKRRMMHPDLRRNPAYCQRAEALGGETAFAAAGTCSRA